MAVYLKKAKERPKFVKAVTYPHATKEGSLKIAHVRKRVCHYENMLAHGLSSRFRIEKYGSLAATSGPGFYTYAPQGKEVR
jgi:hypothetical protein